MPDRVFPKFRISGEMRRGYGNVGESMNHRSRCSRSEENPKVNVERAVQYDFMQIQKRSEYLQKRGSRRSRLACRGTPSFLASIDSKVPHLPPRRHHITTNLNRSPTRLAIGTGGSRTLCELLHDRSRARLTWFPVKAVVRLG